MLFRNAEHFFDRDGNVAASQIALSLAYRRGEFVDGANGVHYSNWSRYDEYIVSESSVGYAKQIAKVKEHDSVPVKDWTEWF